LLKYYGSRVWGANPATKKRERQKQIQRERDRQTAKAIWSELHSVHSNVSEMTMTTNLPVAGPKSDRDEEYCNERNG
jgi:hypothetical protein